MLVYFVVVTENLATDGAVESIRMLSPTRLLDPKTIDGELVQFDSINIQPKVWVILSRNVLVYRPLSAPYKQVGSFENLGLFFSTSHKSLDSHGIFLTDITLILVEHSVPTVFSSLLTRVSMCIRIPIFLSIMPPVTYLTRPWWSKILRISSRIHLDWKVIINHYN